MSHVDEGTLHAYLDGELPPVERERVDSHLKGCPACQARLAEERALIERADRLLGMAAPPERALPPLDTLRKPRILWRLRRPLAWAATIVLAVGIGWYARGSFSLMQTRTSTAETGMPQAAAAPPAAPSERPAPSSGLHDESKDHENRERDAEPPAVTKRLPNNALATRSQAAALATGRVDSLTPQGGLELRGGRPLPASAPASDAASGVIARDAAPRRQAIPIPATSWPIIASQPAREVLGADPVVIPGFAIRAYRRNPVAAEIVVEQVTDLGTPISLIERRADSGFDGRAETAALNAPTAMAKSVNERLARFVGSLRVEIEGPLAPDSLSRLLELAR